jgi:hypothetical protein
MPVAATVNICVAASIWALKRFFWVTFVVLHDKDYKIYENCLEMLNWQYVWSVARKDAFEEWLNNPLDPSKALRWYRIHGKEPPWHSLLSVKVLISWCYLLFGEGRVNIGRGL